MRFVFGLEVILPGRQIKRQNVSSLTGLRTALAVFRVGRLFSRRGRLRFYYGYIVTGVFTPFTAKTKLFE